MPVASTASVEALARRAPGAGVYGLRVCVLGGERAGASLAWALAARLARLPPARCASLCSAPADPGNGSARPLGPSSPTMPTARRVARCLENDGYQASARGRVISAGLPDAPDDVRELYAAIDAQAPGAPLVTLLRGVRRPGFDALVASQDLVLVVLAAEAPSSLSALAVAELALVAPGALVQAVPLAARHGMTARRAAVGRALEALR